jgi:hypothetical protein
MPDVLTAEKQTTPVTRGSRTLVVVFTATSFMGAFLLFLVEPMAAKFLLPMLGGSPAVWNTAMVFFQATLLAGYAAAHLMLTRLPVRRQAILQVGLMGAALLALPIALPRGWQAPTGDDPAMWTLVALVVMVGAPFFMLSTVGPTLQRWFSRTTHPRAADPYFLYAAGNVGSLLALLAYPFVLEPAMPLSRQSSLWAWLYASFIVACGACAALLVRHRASEPSTIGAMSGAADVSERPTAGPIGWRRGSRWVLLAFIPSALMLGVTRYLSSDIASVPLLWVVPLSLYLATFIVAFGHDPDRVVRLSSRAFRVLAVPLALSFLGIIPSLWIELPLQLAGFTAAALVAHGRLASDRPGVSLLTRFFLLLSLGGVLGGIFAALIAPLIFTTVLEYPIAIVLALAVLPGEGRSGSGFGRPRLDARGAVLSFAALAVAVVTVAIRSDGSQRSLTLAMLVAAAGLASAFVLARRPIGFAGAVGVVLLLAQLLPANPTLFAERTFFGVHRVYEDPGGRHVLLNGTTVHGMQNEVDGRLVDDPISYYSRGGPLGDVFAAAGDGPRALATIGAGAGSVAAYLRPEDSLTFFEIDAAVVRIASDPSLFTFVSDSAGSVRFVLGDGRIELGRSPDTFDVIVVDAFSGDAIPTHLLTDEAMRVYLQHLTVHGLVVFNISNRYFDLGPVLARIAAQEGLAGAERADTALSPQEQSGGELPSTWVAVARSPQDLGDLRTAAGWTPIGNGAGTSLWTDDYTNLLGTLR